MKMESCCTCATILSQVPRHSKSEKPLPLDRRLDCCSRVICAGCISKNDRFSQYCPYCQISTVPTALPQGLKEPPAYDAIATSSSENPPPYSGALLPKHHDCDDGKSSPDAPPAEDVLHFLNHSHDTITSLSLRYDVPAPVLRRVNNIASDHLLMGRRTAIIPGEFYKGGVSFSPRPIEGEEEELRKGKIRRFMVGCKVSEYDVAVLYLEQTQYDLEAAVATFTADKEWERQHPARLAGRGKELTFRRI